jgi:hypothetical protein
MPDIWLVPVGFLVVQSIHIYRFDGGFDLIVGLVFGPFRHINPKTVQP